MGENVINNTRRKRRWKVIFGILVLLTVMVLVYALPYHHAVLPDDYGTDGLVTVTKMNSGWLFDGAGDDQAMIFYPGAKVDSMAYAPLMWELAEEGLDCYLVDMPFHLAFFGIGRAGKIMKECTYDTWYMGGHSLGGAMAANYAAAHLDAVHGLLLLAAYPTRTLRGENLHVLTIYGSEDDVLNLERLRAARKLLPEDAVEIVLEGGNHAQFGCYGPQNGDGVAAISPDEQRRKTREAVFQSLLH